MRLSIPLGIADAELVKFLSALGPGKLRSPFDAEVIHFTALNDLRKKKLLPPIPPIYTQGTLVNNFDTQFTREEIGKELVKFTVDHTLFGALGMIWLRSAEDRYSDLDYEMPPFPSWEEARNLLNRFLRTRPNLKISGDRDDQEMLYGLETITFEPGNLHTRRTKLQQAILGAYLYNIYISLGASFDQSWLTSTQEFIIELPIRDVLVKVDSFLKTHPVDKEVKVQHFVLGPGEVYGVELTHDALGNLWSITLEAQIGNYTKVQLTLPIHPSGEKTGETGLKSDLPGSSTTSFASDWAWSYFEALVKYLKINMRKEQSTAQEAEESKHVEQPVKRKYAPNRKTDYDQWVFVWRKIKGWRSEYGILKPEALRDKLDDLHRRKEYRGTVFSTDTIRKIIKAGDAGELETS